jgi:hypothetical protein
MLTPLFALLAATAAFGTKIHPRGDTRFCLQVVGNQANGEAVVVNSCTGAAGQEWDISPGSTKVKLSGTNYCLDAGSSTFPLRHRLTTGPGNGIKMKIWQCYGGLAAQQFYLTGDGRIAVEGKGQCLDLMNGSLAPYNTVQTWQCSTGNNNQYWTVGGGGPPPTTTPPPSTPTPCQPSTVTVTVTRETVAPIKRENRYQH